MHSYRSSHHRRRSHLQRRLPNLLDDEQPPSDCLPELFGQPLRSLRRWRLQWRIRRRWIRRKLPLPPPTIRDSVFPQPTLGRNPHPPAWRADAKYLLGDVSRVPGIAPVLKPPSQVIRDLANGVLFYLSQPDYTLKYLLIAKKLETAPRTAPRTTKAPII